MSVIVLFFRNYNLKFYFNVALFNANIYDAIKKNLNRLHIIFD